MTTMNNNDKLTVKRKIGIPALHARIATPVPEQDVNAMPNRIALMLDVSGSMSGAAGDKDHKSKIEHLRDAMQSYIGCCNFKDTALAIEPFGLVPEWRVPLTSLQPMLLMTAMSLDARTDTPIAEAMTYVMKTYSITRGIIVSDGGETSGDASATADGYREACVPIDCVHIGMDTNGERLLKTIAEKTGGVFIKFTDVSSFAKNFKYLTPAFYGQLTSGCVGAEELGAKEIDK